MSGYWGNDLTPPYRTIVADPPWRYSSSPLTGMKGGSTLTYSTMTNAEIAALPVRDLVANDAHCYLWTTNVKMFGDGGGPRPDEILRTWGFRYVTLLTWVKTGPLGMGRYFRGETEHVLFGVRGSLPIPPADRVRNVFTAPKTGHSRKPTHFFDMVERVSPGPYAELFSRDPRLGWDSWGYGYEIGGAA